MTEVALRPVTPDDEAFLRRVYGSTREDELAMTPWTDEQKAAFVAFQFQAQSTHYAGNYPDAAHDVIVVDGEPAGRLYVNRTPELVHVVDIAILPEFRGRGVGTSLLGDLLAEAAAAGKKVSIHVEHQNPARRLYERLGFEQVDEEGIYLLMEVRPGTS